MRRAFATFLGLLLTVSGAAAQDPGIITDGNADCDFKTGLLQPDCLPMVIGNAVAAVFFFSAAICLINIILAGYQIAIGGITGEGDTGGKTRLKNALVGFFVTATTFGIINLAFQSVV